LILSFISPPSFFFFLLLPRPPTSTLFPYTTLFRSPFGGNEQLEHIAVVMESVPLLRFHLDSGHAKLERGYDRWEEYLTILGRKRSEEHTSELQSPCNLVCRLLLEKKKKNLLKMNII